MLDKALILMFLRAGFPAGLSQLLKIFEHLRKFRREFSINFRKMHDRSFLIIGLTGVETFCIFDYQQIKIKSSLYLERIYFNAFFRIKLSGIKSCANDLVILLQKYFGCFCQILIKPGFSIFNDITDKFRYPC